MMYRQAWSGRIVNVGTGNVSIRASLTVIQISRQKAVGCKYYLKEDEDCGIDLKRCGLVDMARVCPDYVAVKGDNGDRLQRVRNKG